jgi:hypothetical protein
MTENTEDREDEGGLEPHTLEGHTLEGHTLEGHDEEESSGDDA